ncbi:hypothetical protein [Nocardia sp.]|uniref:hypothetical protein n=1 Tax=Nocardia sp. TaxID=1821 RepID=UPI00258B58A5|nr:hypothetical protein [Nocardia sp.]
MPDGYDRDRDSFDNNERGRIFENGADRLFKDRENGYISDSRIYSAPAGKIMFDKVKTRDGNTFTIEEKSGRIDGKKDEKQLKVIKALLETGAIQHHTLRSVEREFISGNARDIIDAMVREFPDRFTHHVISRADAREIWARGLQLERGQQLELPQVRQLARDHKTQQQARTNAHEHGPETGRDTRAHVNEPRAPEREPESVVTQSIPSVERERVEQLRTLAMAAALERGRDLDTARQAVRDAITAQALEVAASRAQGRELDPEHLRDAHTALSAGLDQIRERECQNTRNMLTAAGTSPEQIAILAPVLEQNREARREETVRQLDSIGKEVQRHEWVQELTPHNARAQQRGIEHVQQIEQQAKARTPEHELRVQAAQREAERLFIDPAKDVELDLEKFRAVRYGRSLGYDPEAKAHTYQRSGRPPVQVEHDARERELAVLAKNVERNLSVEQINIARLAEAGHSAPVEEAARSRALEAPIPTAAREQEHGRERGLYRGR